MHFSDRIEVNAPLEEIWNFLWRAEQVGACLPGCRDVRTIEPFAHYCAIVEERVGPFRACFDWQIDVEDQQPMSRIAILARGRDNKLAATARVQMTVTLERVTEGASVIDLDTELQITGKIASLGQTVMKRTADQVVRQFARALQERLDRVESGAADA